MSVPIIHWHCFQVSNARAQLAKEINLYKKELAIALPRNDRNMTRGLRVDPVRGSAQGTKGGPGDNEVLSLSISFSQLFL